VFGHAGNIDVAATKEAVHKDYSWIPKGDDITRESPAERSRRSAAARDRDAGAAAAMLIGYPMPRWSERQERFS